jgi:uncharacterized membrane protein YoaK (UPF0700 family)
MTSAPSSNTPSSPEIPLLALRVALLLLTLVAGWVDAMCFVGIGRVFSSFMSGNVLFLGIAAGKGDTDLLWRALLVLLAFFLGTMAGTVILARRTLCRRGLDERLLGLEAIFLLPFAVGWDQIQGQAGDIVLQLMLLGLAAVAMGLQGAAVDALNLPGVATNAITGTITLIGRMAGLRTALVPLSAVASVNFLLTFLLTLCSTYAIGAILVVTTLDFAGAGMVPVAAPMAAAWLARRDRDDLGA